MSCQWTRLCFKVISKCRGAQVQRSVAKGQAFALKASAVLACSRKARSFM